MNTPIISISDDQNTITHESGVVTVFKNNGNYKCHGCVYNPELCPIIIPCVSRKDKENGIFKLKQ